MRAVELLHVLLPPVLPRNARLGPEDRLAVGVANALRAASLQGRLDWTWSHVPSQFDVRGGDAAHAVARKVALRKAMGALPGAPDLVFVAPAAGGWIELKPRGPGDLSPAQRAYRSWCESLGVRHAVCRTEADVLDALTAWGGLRR